MTCSYEEMIFWHSTVRIVIVCAAVAVLHVVQENSALHCWRMYLFNRIVRGMLVLPDSLIVIKESICKTEGRQLQHCSSPWFGGEGGDGLLNAMLGVVDVIREVVSGALPHGSVLEGTWTPEPENDELEFGKLPMRPVLGISVESRK